MKFEIDCIFSLGDPTYTIQLGTSIAGDSVVFSDHSFMVKIDGEEIKHTVAA